MLDAQQKWPKESMTLFCSFLTLIWLIGCSSGQQMKSTGDTRTPVLKQGYQRFIPIAHGQGFLSFPYWAFDTKTGQLCKAWDWQSNSAASKKAKESGNSSELTGLDAAAQGTPTCKDLWKSYGEDGKSGGNEKPDYVYVPGKGLVKQ